MIKRFREHKNEFAGFEVADELVPETAEKDRGPQTENHADRTKQEKNGENIKNSEKNEENKS